MAVREQRCKACDGSGLLADDESWQYTCTVCGGDGVMDMSAEEQTHIIDVDETNRILD